MNTPAAERKAIQFVRAVADWEWVKLSFDLWCQFLTMVLPSGNGEKP